MYEIGRICIKIAGSSGGSSTSSSSSSSGGSRGCVDKWECRVGRVITKGKKIAYIGEISPNVLEKWELTTPVSAFELNITELFSAVFDK